MQKRALHECGATDLVRELRQNHPTLATAVDGQDRDSSSSSSGDDTASSSSDSSSDSSDVDEPCVPDLPTHQELAQKFAKDHFCVKFEFFGVICFRSRIVLYRTYGTQWKINFVFLPSQLV